MNRNWDFHWNEQGVEGSCPCSPIYPGTEPFSEEETRNYATFLRGLAGKIHTFVSFHSYSQRLLSPYGHTSEAAKNAADLQLIGEAAVEALAQRYGTKYEVGNIHDTIYPAFGTSIDYVYDVLDVPVAFAFELRPGSGSDGFELPTEQIVPVGRETVDALVAMLAKARELGYNRPKGISG